MCMERDRHPPRALLAPLARKPPLFFDSSSVCFFSCPAVCASGRRPPPTKASTARTPGLRPIKTDQNRRRLKGTIP
eukprot:1160071-Pelagomonas_calceolata.AAC.22